MALFPSLMEIIIGLHESMKLTGPVIALGVQDCVLNYIQVEPILRNAKRLIKSIPKQQRRNTTNVNLISAGLENAIHAETFFAMLGLEPYHDIDLFVDNKPTFVHDLNKEIPSSWENTYNLLIDAGCLEHIFNIPIGLTNSVKLLKVGGIAIHSNPLNNLVNHGYFQFSPILLKEFYDRNGFQVLHRFVVGQELWRGLFTKPYVSGNQRDLKFQTPCQYWLVTIVEKKEEVQITFPSQRIHGDDLDYLRSMIG